MRIREQIQERNVRLWQFCVIFCTLILCVTCTTQTSKNSSFSFQSGKTDDLREAEQYFEEGQYKRALLKYTSYVYSPYPVKERIPYARYKLGLTHYMLGQHKEAVATLSKLIEEYPAHPMASQAREIIDKSQQQVSDQHQDRMAKQVEIYQKLQQMEHLVQENPENSDYHFQLGNLHWQLGQHDRAVLAYRKASELNPRYLENNLVKDRVRITSEGQYVVKDTILDQYKPDDVRVVNANLQKKIDRNWLGEKESLIFSAEVINSGIRDVKNVQVEVTLYDFFDRIQDTRLLPVGSLPAGIRRPVATVFTQFKGLGIDINFRTRVIYTQ